MSGRRKRTPDRETRPQATARDRLLLYLLLAIAAAVIYAPAIDAPFISDDKVYLEFNPWVQQISLENIWAMLDPGSSNNLVTANYAPTQMLAHMAQWAVFGTETVGYRLTNFALHALIGVLFAALLIRSGAPTAAATVGAGLFLFHPASAEVATWISQLKTLAAMALVLAALLVRERSTTLGAVFFLLGLLAKPMAAVALPVVAALEWVRRGESGAAEFDRATLFAWSGIFLVFAGVAVTSFQAANVGIPPIADDPLLRVLSTATFGARYLVMAVSSYGVSAWQEPGAASGFGDPWVWLALALGGGLAWRTIHAGRQKLPEFPYWIWAAAAFVPVSQVLPFRYPMADRYLYFILPGLIGGVWFAAATQWNRLPDPLRARAARVVLAASIVVLLLFAVGSRQRAVVWSTAPGPTLDAIERWPDGAQAQRKRGRAAIYAGDWELGLPLLAFAAERRVLTLPHILEDRVLGPRVMEPKFQPLLQSITRREIELLTEEPQTTEYGWIRLAQAQLIAREFDAAETSLLRAQELEGSHGAIISQLLVLARTRQPIAPGAAARR